MAIRSLANLINAAVLAMGMATTACDERQYGCDRKDEFQKTGDKTYEGTVDCRYYKHDTGVTVKDGEYIEIELDGKCCWQSGACADPDGDDGVWGAYWMFENTKNPQDKTEAMKLGHGFKGNVKLPGDGEYKVNIIIPDWNDKEKCFSFYNQDNSGEYDVKVRK